MTSPSSPALPTYTVIHGSIMPVIISEYGPHCPESAMALFRHHVTGRSHGGIQGGVEAEVVPAKHARGATPGFESARRAPETWRGPVDRSGHLVSGEM